MRGGLRSLLLYLALGLVCLVFLPNLPPHIDFVEKNPEFIPWVGTLKPNNKMDVRETLSTKVQGAQFGEIKGPESFAVLDNYLYTGIQGGDIIRINLDNPLKGTWETVWAGAPCAGQHQEVKCGRPLGMVVHPNTKELVVADANHGLYTLNVKTKVRTTLVPGFHQVEGKPNMVTNSVAIAKDGTMYYTTSSTEFVLGDGVFEFLSTGSGRLMKFDPSTKTSQVLMEGLIFANGVALADDDSYVLVNEVGSDSVHKFHLAGAKRGQKEVLLKTPGIPDNIKPLGNGKFLVGIIVPRIPDKFSPNHDFFYKFPRLARFQVRVMYYWQQLFAWAHRVIYPADWLKRAAYMMGNFELILPITTPYGLLIEVDGASGKILKSWHASKGDYGKVCEGVKVGEWIYLGSPYNHEVSRIKY